MDTSAKQQVAERLKTAQNVLVTVSNNPSVDQLAACIGLTLLLNRTGKHATAVFSGQVPSTLEFLQPEKTIERNTDSLRDFIISLDKEKADKLRYKVEDQVVKIFITPYKTSLSEKDLVFSQGDFNIEAVVALGVKDKNQLDAAITAHGRILHDATVISVNAGAEKAANIGQINWSEPTASSLSEMIVSISEALGSNLIDNQMATAFLTGIVAETQRFSNPKTSPKVMTMSAQLMAAGANQQLIVSKLETEPAAQPVEKKEELPKPAEQPPPPKPDGELSVQHVEEKPKPEPKAEIKLPEPPKMPEPPKEKVSEHEIKIDQEGNLKRANDPDEPQADTAEPTPNAHALLDPNNGGPVLETAFTANTQPTWGLPQNEASDAFSQSTGSDKGILTHAKDVAPLGPTPDPNLAQPQTPSPQPHVEQARNAVESAFAAAPFDAANNPVQSLNAVPLEPAPAPEQPPQQDNNPAPPPVPPPLPPVNFSTASTQPRADNPLDNTL